MQSGLGNTAAGFFRAILSLPSRPDGSWIFTSASGRAQPPYDKARRVFWIMDNGSAHRGAKCVARLQEKLPRLVPVHGPVHASWLKQIEIYFSIVQRKVLTPNDFPSLAAVEERLLAFQDHYQAIAQPFTWTFTRRDLATLLNKLSSATDPVLRMAA